MTYDFDVIVLGSGAGGATFAHACAAAGKSVLVAERGPRVPTGMRPHDEQANLIDKLPYDDRTIEVNRQPRRLYMGGIVGGSTALYGGAMLRPARDDFHPGKYYATHLPRSRWDWPIVYDDLAPYYDRAEQLFRLASDANLLPAPLEPPGQHASPETLPMAPINQRLIAMNQRAGLTPFRLPLTIETRLCESCSHCAGFLCPHDARRSATHVVQETVADFGAQLLTSFDVDRLEFDQRRRVSSVRLRDRRTQEVREYSARCYALACGAIGSPAIALRSGISAPQLGRNYMMHYSPIAAGIFWRSTGADETFVKQVGFSDFYFGTPELPEKMGLVQSLPAPGPLMLGKSGLSRVPRVALQMLRRRMLPLAGIVEDLPIPNNRVSLNQDGSICLTHQFTEFDRQRGESLGREMARILKRAGAVSCTVRPFPSMEHVAHQCGTMRLGATPDDAVVDVDCRLFGTDNLVVVDGSVLPSSLGVGPSLTIAANAMRVAESVIPSI